MATRFVALLCAFLLAAACGKEKKELHRPLEEVLGYMAADTRGIYARVDEDFALQAQALVENDQPLPPGLAPRYPLVDYAVGGRTMRLQPAYAPDATPPGLFLQKMNLPQLLQSVLDNVQADGMVSCPCDGKDHFGIYTKDEVRRLLEGLRAKGRTEGPMKLNLYRSSSARK